MRAVTVAGLLIVALVCGRVLAADTSIGPDFGGPGAIDVPREQRPHPQLVPGALDVAWWVRDHPNDPRTPAIAQRIAPYPIAMWVTGDIDDDLRNVGDIVQRARRADGLAQLVLYNIPDRDDGFSGPNRAVKAQTYRGWVDRISAAVADTRVVVLVEPDALWFADRVASEGTDFDSRLASIRYAVDTFSTKNPRAQVYIDAGTASGSVTPGRMAELLVKAGASAHVGYAVNVSSFAPDWEITDYAQAIRGVLQAWHGIADPRYVVDTSHNGAPEWNNDWCNPPGRRLGKLPQIVDAPDGLDMNLWVLAPGASNGPCGIAPNTPGGEFSPVIATELVS